MSLATNVSELATAVATEVKRNRTWINGNAADLSALATTNRTNLVAAINEVAGSVAGASGIDDDVTSTTTSWSSQKTSDEIGAASTADRDRANHTGTQAIATVSGLQGALDGKQPLDSDLTTIAGLTHADDTILQTKAGAWTARTPAQVKTDLGLATVATSGAYTDLSGKPAIPTSYSDLTGTVPQSALPAIALTEFLGAVASQAAMLALTGQRGDWATRTDLGTDWQLIAEPSSTLANWREMTYPASPVSSVNGRTGAVTGLAEAADVGDTATNFVDVFTAGLA